MVLHGYRCVEKGGQFFAFQRFYGLCLETKHGVSIKDICYKRLIGHGDRFCPQIPDHLNSAQLKEFCPRCGQVVDLVVEVDEINGPWQRISINRGLILMEVLRGPIWKGR
ncbi:unnamed protein product [Cuscuta europaea]|uniref:Uncharacterized protein n=1 Tax=Cuscuta europaea TaxID=41803 RepID=A0A9P0ZIS4_CUSEU|nr:unnamed protein product [Cuscuta europaea]